MTQIRWCQIHNQQAQPHPHPADRCRDFAEPVPEGRIRIGAGRREWTVPSHDCHIINVALVPYTTIGEP